MMSGDETTFILALAKPRFLRGFALQLLLTAARVNAGAHPAPSAPNLFRLRRRPWPQQAR